MDENTWRLAQMFMWMIGIQTTVLLAILGGIWGSISGIKKDIRDIHEDLNEIRKDIARIDKEVAIITATLKFNGYDLTRHKAEGE